MNNVDGIDQIIKVDYRGGWSKGGTWPRGRATPRHYRPRSIEDARFIYISYALLADLHYFEQVKIYQKNEK